MSEEAENPFELLPDFVLAMILSMLTTSDLLKAMVLTCFHDPVLSHFSKIVCKRWLFITQHESVVWENRLVCIHMQPERFQKMLCSFSKKNFFVQHLKATGNDIGDAGAESISRALQSNTSLKSLDISGVLFCSSIFHTTDKKIGASGAERISIALQSNTSLKSLDIRCVLFCEKTFHTQQITILEILVLRAYLEHFNQTLHSHHLILAVLF